MASAATRSQAPLTDVRLGHRPEHEAAVARSAVAALVHDTGELVAARWNSEAGVGGEPVNVDAAIAVLAAAVVSGLSDGPLPPLHAYPWTALAPRLIADLRRGVLVEGAARGVGAADLIRVLEQLESLLIAAEEDVATRFVQHLIGPSALELMVEIAHDVRSPLGSILFLVERMRRGGTGPVTPGQERHLGLVYSAAFGLSTLASDMMELAHGGARLIGPAPVQFSMSDLLHAVRDVVQPIAEEKGLGLRFSAPRRDVRVGHPAALSRVLLNLITNALKFTNNGSVTVTAVEDSGDAVRFCVEDTGRGMPPALMARVTDVFARSGGGASHAFSSAGLGIAICRKLLHAMGGTLEFSAVQPIGTRAEFVLCLASPSDFGAS